MSRHQLPEVLAAVLLLSAVSTGLAQGAAPSPAAQTDAQIAVLKSDSSLKAKSDACRELATLGDPRAVPVLAGLLANERLSHMARYALEPIDDASVDAALRKALGTLKGPLRVGVIGSIGMRRDAKAVESLTKLLAGSGNATAAAAAAALGRIATDEAVAALAGFRRIAPTPLRAVAADASLTAAERLLERGKSKGAAAIYTELQRGTWPAHVRLGAFSGLLAADDDRAPEMIIRAIASEDTSLRTLAISRISTLKGRGVASRFAAELTKASPEVQVPLIAALVNIGDPVAAEAIVSAAGHNDASVRLAAVKALGALGNAKCVPMLCRTATASKSPAEIHAALSSLKALSGDGVDAALIRCVKVAGANTRTGLIDVLIVRGTAGASPMLLAQAKTCEGAARVTAFGALGKLAKPRELPALLELLTALDDETARTAAERAAVAVARRIPDPAARADAVLAALDAASAMPARHRLIRVLGGIGNAKAFATVAAALTDKDVAVRDVAVRVLAAWPDANALDALTAVFLTADNDVHRVLALRGCVRLLGLADRPDSQKLPGYRKLMAAAKRVDDKKRVLAGLGTVASGAAVAIIEPYLTDPQVGPEAELAMLGIAQALVGSSAPQAKAVAGKLMAASKNRIIRRRAAQIISSADRFGDYLVAWQVSGPYRKAGVTGEPLLNVVFGPESGAKTVTWRALPVRGAQGKPPWMLDLMATGTGTQHVAYLRTWIHAERARAAVLEIGADDGVKAWLNEKLVHVNLTGGPAVPGEEKVSVSLKSGWNALVLKIAQQTGPWEFCARVRTPDGGPLAGLRIDPTRKATTAKLPVASGTSGTPAKIFEPVGNWTPLFNGKDLTGWNETGNAIFKIEDGNLVGTQTTGKGGDLWTDAEFDNFELRITYRVGWPANSGFWFRHNGKRGYQYDVLKYKRPVAFSGTLYCPGKMFLTRNLNEKLENRDGWNEARLRAAGQRLTLWLNDTQTGDVRDNTLVKGKIGIQIHPGGGFKGMKMIIKRMELRRLRARGE